MASAMQSILPLNVGKYSNFDAKRQFLIPARSQRNVSLNRMRARATAEDGDKVDERRSPAARPAPPTPTPKVSTNFSDLLAFSGPAPERINGRLAMVGFVAAAAIEASKGQDLFAQIGNGGATWFVVTSVVFSLASLIPLLRGVTVESKSEGVMTSDAELWNGRLAMIGLVALAVTDFVKYY